MKVLCRRAISPTTGEDLGDSSPWLKIGNEYTVLSLSCAEEFGFNICIQTEQAGQPGFYPLVGFEVIDQRIPSSWITIIGELRGRKAIEMLPATWDKIGLFERVLDEEPEAIAIFNEAVKIIYEEEEAFDASNSIK